jgi:glycosyltransferase involved in cell wall biosynthesis
MDVDRGAGPTSVAAEGLADQPEFDQARQESPGHARTPAQGPRVLHAPTDVGGNAYGLSRAERELGYVSDVAVFSPGPFGYGYDIDLHAGVDQPVWRRLARRTRFLAGAVREYDVFHFNFGQTILTVRQFGLVLDELAWLKRRGKTILVTYQGSDVRPFERCPCGRSWCIEAEPYRQPAARRFLRYADRVFYLNPDLREWLPGARFVPYASVDARFVTASPVPERGELVVAHAPTDQLVKGTKHVVEAVEALQREGLSVRLDLIEGASQDEVLRRTAEADLVVDQLLLGWYGAFAVEAMAIGRPVLAYIRENEPDDNPFGAELPIVRTTPATLVDDLRLLAPDLERRRELGAAGRRFTEGHHDPRRIARAVLDGIASPPQAHLSGTTFPRGVSAETPG